MTRTRLLIYDPPGNGNMLSRAVFSERRRMALSADETVLLRMCMTEFTALRISGRAKGM
ncbi:MAG: hypothetical protein ACUVX8_05260 [Candidatus Zipacnadales bacterium]